MNTMMTNQILSKRNNVLKVVCLLVGLISFCSSYSQLSKLEKVIVADFQIIDKIYNDNVFIILERNCDTVNNYFRTISVDTTHVSLPNTDNKSLWPAYIIKVTVKVNESFVINLPYESKKKLSADTLQFMYLSFRNEVYKLFGFYCTDIQLFVYRNGWDATKELKKELVEKNILSRYQGKLFFKSIKLGKSRYNNNIDKPSSLLKYYYNEYEQYKASTIILPIEPLLW